MRIAVAITGSSGAVYAVEFLKQCPGDKYLIMPIPPPLYFLPKTVDEYSRAFADKVPGVIGARQSKGWRAESWNEGIPR
ncbi:MAG: hypothetical protein ONB46_19835 [candidate division KSB1 bacterium]|nr:hypothetical protein [candidate division KSB1 bacterium]MDZ7368131.1 hypothetical protein [candidate division KSB1 bacterium]MDZ7405809.1 hypothetical protein [candidate division KSB1 bacterium]